MNNLNNKFIINLDVDGGDNAPISVLKGAELYLTANQNVPFMAEEVSLRAKLKIYHY